jgi:hypothetical protein
VQDRLPQRKTWATVSIAQTWIKGGYVLCSLGTELASLNVQHEIPTADIFHDEIYSGFCLETGMQVEQERMALLVRNEEHPLLRPCTLHLVVLDDEFLLQDFDSIELLGALGLS